MILKAYKYRLYPTAQQRLKIERTLGSCRFLYNLALETKNTAFFGYGKKLSSFDLCYQLPELKKEVEWLNEVDSQALQASVKKIDVAFKNYFRQLKDGTVESKKKAYIKSRVSRGLPIDNKKLNSIGKPKFKSKRNGGSFQCPNNVRRINWENSTLTIPKIKDIPIVVSRTFEGKIKTVTISKTPTGKYFASILVETPNQLPIKKTIAPETTIGIDLGITDFAITSDGRKFENPKFLKNELQRLKVYQRRASRKKLKSSNRKKADRKAAVLHEKITNKRNDYLHKLSSKLISENQTNAICLESLAVANMIKNHHLAQSISDVSWSNFVNMLKYKAEWNGKNLIFIGRFEPSSKRCNCCGFINHDLTLSQREWDCPQCHSPHDRDINGAKNIKFVGLQTGKRIPEGLVEMPALAGSMKQELSRY